MEHTAVGGQALNVSMEEDISNLNEVVVTGYQTIDRKLFTGAATAVKASDVKRDGITDVSRKVESVIYIQSLENSQLTWEKQYETNVGIDAGFFQDRLTLTVDDYLRQG